MTIVDQAKSLLLIRNNKIIGRTMYTGIPYDRRTERTTKQKIERTTRRARNNIQTFKMPEKYERPSVNIPVYLNSVSPRKKILMRSHFNVLEISKFKREFYPKYKSYARYILSQNTLAHTRTFSLYIQILT